MSRRWLSTMLSGFFSWLASWFGWSRNGSPEKRSRITRKVATFPQERLRGYLGLVWDWVKAKGLWLALFVASSLSRAYALLKGVTPDNVEPFLRVAVVVVVVGLVRSEEHTSELQSQSNLV